jgi:hypothetical protein
MRQRNLVQCRFANLPNDYRVRARQVTDGPFTETREQLGGYFLIDAANLDDAIDIGGRVPAGKKGTVEVRPVVEVAGLPSVG